MAKRKRRYEYHSPESEAAAKANLPQYRKKTIEEIRKEAKKFQDRRKNLKDLDIIEFAENPAMLGLSFTRRPAQKVILKVLYGLPLKERELEIFKILTKNKGKYKPGMEKTEAVLALGARAGKSFLVSICALYEAVVGWLTKPWKETLSIGEYVYVCIIATRELQARQIIQTNCLRMLRRSPLLKGLVKKSTELEITLKNYVKIISGPCNSTAMRGLPIIFLALDEIAFYRVEGPRADEAIFNSLRPRQAQFEGNKLFLLSTAGSKQGLFFDFFNEGFNVQDRLTCQAPTDFVNPLIPKAFLEKEKARDIDNYLREFEAIFSEKIESFFGFELMQKVFTLAGDLPYKSSSTYFMAFDQSGLSGRDRFAVSIAHSEKDIATVDCVRSWATKDLDVILSEAGSLAKKYHLSKCLIDKYAVGYVRNVFKKIGLEIEIRPSLADVFVSLKSLCLREKIQLPDRPDLRAGMRNTLAVYNKSNQLSITHQRGSEGHADEIDACASAIFAVSKKMGGSGIRIRSLDTEDEEDDNGRNWVDIGGRPGGNLLPEKYHQI
ncbi:hypothetical protein ES705_38996 [subsurface metagenome]